ncbi:MAG: hypothetical protein V1714_00700 [Pseudomonadota bacterium]
MNAESTPHGINGIKPKAIVLPLWVFKGTQLDGIGLGLHFLLGNVLVLNSRLQEMWFGWRVKMIFPQKEDLVTYFRGEGSEPDILQLAKDQNIRYWISGHVENQVAHLNMADAKEKLFFSKQIPFLPEDQFLGFRSTLLNWLGTCGIPFDDFERRKALWPEKLSLEGLDALGRALLSFYLFSSYDPAQSVNADPFVRAVALCPFSYMTQNLLGWARYRRGEYDSAKAAFSAAINENPAGAGAMAGLMWCAVMTGQEKEALDWAAGKAEICGEALESAKEKVLHLFKGEKRA